MTRKKRPPKPGPLDPDTILTDTQREALAVCAQLSRRSQALLVEDAIVERCRAQLQHHPKHRELLLRLADEACKLEIGRVRRGKLEIGRVRRG